MLLRTKRQQNLTPKPAKQKQNWLKRFYLQLIQEIKDKTKDWGMLQWITFLYHTGLFLGRNLIKRPLLIAAIILIISEYNPTTGKILDALKQVIELLINF
ncbi:hypothetical protein [Risungbinella massiliensis]|uniref:hypothetical protein n=1 Tax=Risungbinella massiliensis TaxID=1329796 RepID=UPI0005CBB3AD|nr:hypothetical protein [Risungbinella massiliensis]